MIPMTTQKLHLKRGTVLFLFNIPTVHYNLHLFGKSGVEYDLKMANHLFDHRLILITVTR